MRFAAAATTLLSLTASLSAAPVVEEVDKRQLLGLNLGLGTALGLDLNLGGLLNTLGGVVGELGSTVGGLGNTLGGFLVEDLSLVGKLVDKTTGKVVDESGKLVGHVVGGVLYKVDVATGLLIEEGIQITIGLDAKIKTAFKFAFKGLVIVDGVIKAEGKVVGKVVNDLIVVVDKTGKTIGLGLKFIVGIIGKITSTVVVSLIGAVIDKTTGLVKIGDKVVAKVVAGVVYAVDESLHVIGEGYIFIIDASAKITALVKIELIGLVLTAEKTLIIGGKVVAKTINGLLYFVTEEGKAIGAGLLLTVEATGKIVSYKVFDLVGFAVKAGVIVDKLGKTVGKIVNGLAISLDVTAKITIGLSAQISVVKDVISGVVYKL